MILSIIIPAYNAEKFLSLLLDSILSQSFKDFEIIIVNDGSTDNTAQILTDYSANDKRIKVIHKSNEGVAIARNIALKQAQGEYILFCDADDIMFPDALQHIVDTIQQTPVDYLRYEFRTIDIKGQNLYPNYEARQRKEFCGKVVDAATCIKKIVRNEFFLWSGIFKHSIIKENNITFFEGCTYNEDTLFMLRFFTNSHYHLYIYYTAYGYRKFSEAVTFRFTERNYQDIKKVFIKLIFLYNNAKIDMQKAIKPTIDLLGLRICKYAIANGRNHEIIEIINFCSKQPTTIEWHLIKSFNYTKACLLFPFIEIIRKISRRIC